MKPPEYPSFPEKLYQGYSSIGKFYDGYSSQEILWTCHFGL
jgi:hypothetical protein